MLRWTIRGRERSTFSLVPACSTTSRRSPTEEATHRTPRDSYWSPLIFITLVVAIVASPGTPQITSLANTFRVSLDSARPSRRYVEDCLSERVLQRRVSRLLDGEQAPRRHLVQLVEADRWVPLGHPLRRHVDGRFTSSAAGPPVVGFLEGDSLKDLANRATGRNAPGARGRDSRPQDQDR